MNPEKPFQSPDPQACDYATLRREGIRLLERLTGSGWTDFNAHDPGITILEQYCYALTELAYRCEFPPPDLLSREGKDPYGSLFRPARILSSRPVTLADLRRLAVDVRGVKNAWIEPVDVSSPVLFHRREGASPLAHHQENLVQLDAGDGAEPISLKGLFRVLIETSEVLGVAGAEVVRNVARRLHAQRPLGMDFESVTVMGTQNIRVKASIEIGPSGNPDDIYLAILGNIAARISPSVCFYTLAQRLAAGKRIDEIFDGPMLEQGFIDSGELSAMERKTALRVSDFVRDIMDVEGVLMVKHLALSDGMVRNLALSGSVQWEDWWLALAEGKTPVFDIDNSLIRLERRQIEVGVDYAVAKDRYLRAQASLAYRPARPEDLDIMPPVGRDRRVARYYSAQHQFPEVYGLGERGLPSQADAPRRAQLKQLQAYLLFFDQLLGNQFAQLAHVGDLLGFDEDRPQTYFANDIDDPALRLDDVFARAADDRRARVEQIVENPATAADDTSPQIDWVRKNRFLDHLLARFAEQFTDYAQFRQDSAVPLGAGDRHGRLARDKQAWLRRYPELSAGRGIGCNVLVPWNTESDRAKADPDLDNCSGLEHRLRLKLGLDAAVDEARFYLVEHVLLRPLDADKGQQALPLLADARSLDPYSLQVSLVFPGTPKRFQEGGSFRRFVEQTVREETPVHLPVFIHWLDEPGMAAFEAAYRIWMDSQRELREGSDQKTLRLTLGNEAGVPLGFRLRDARDRLIDLLAMGRTYPLADLPVRYTETVTWGQAGRITVMFSQSGVLYQVLHKGGDPLAAPIEAYGHGGALDLPTPAVTVDIGFTLKATKFHTRMSAAALDERDGKVHIEQSRLGTLYELCRKDGSSCDPKIEAPGNGGELILAPPNNVQDRTFKVRAVKPLALMVFQPIDIKVGLDTSLQARILDTELLDPSATDPGIADPRIVDYGTSPRAEILASQAGVDYRLVRVQASQQQADYVLRDPETQASIALKVISTGVVRGDSHAITLQTLPMSQDIDVRILAIKTFEDSENQKEQRGLLEVILPLKVRPDPARAVVATQALLNYRTGTTVVVKGSQDSASYQVFARPIFDSEFIRDPVSSALAIDGMTSLWVKDPPNPTPDVAAVSEAKAGNGRNLSLAIDDLKEDSLVVVRVTKAHETQAGHPPIPSGLQLLQAAVILVRPGPDPDFPLHLQAAGDGAQTGAGLQKDASYRVLNGQPGVFYHFRRAGSDEDLGLPVYFHKSGKGVGQLQVEVDFTVTGSMPTPPPEWDCPVDLAADAMLSVRAVKAQTGLEIAFERTVSALLAAN